MSLMDRGGGAPLLNHYKLEFFSKRLPQTLLGGLKLRLGYDAPLYVYFNQILVFLFPLILSGVFTLLAELQVSSAVICCYVYGSVVTGAVLFANLGSWFVRRRFTNVGKIKANHLAQDDEVDFLSCCGVETVEFLFPAKRYTVNVVVHALLSGPLCALMFLYLLPSNLIALFSSTTITVILYTFGWLTVCVAQYSFTASPPPEPATFRTLDTLEITPLMRPFYVCLFGISGFVSGFIQRFCPEFNSADRVLHAVFPFLLLLWVLGVLPPLDALLTWIAEQFLVLVLGGSPMATELRLLVMLMLSCFGIVLAVSVPNHMTVLVLASCLGYMLSMDIVSLLNHLWLKIKRHSTGSILEDVFQWSTKEYVIHSLMTILATSVTAVSYNFSASAKTSLFSVFGYVFVSLLLLVKVTGDLQGVYLVFGIFRNPFFPRNIQLGSEFKKRKCQLKSVAMLHHLLLAYVCPVLMVVFLGLFLNPQNVNMPTVVIAFGTIRAFRQVWQSTFNCLIEVSVTCCINAQLIGNDAAWWKSAGLGLQLMFVGACRDRIQQLLNKLVFIFTVAISSVLLSKQRHKATVPILIISVIVFPIIIAIVGTSTFLSAPLLPLFCLPVFLIGFPRPLRSWPHTGSTHISMCTDSVYYKQLAPQVLSSLTVSLATGALGNPSPGDHFLIRFQDRLVWVHVLECGYRYCTVVNKGLEMQETSCHTVEAARLDELFEAAFIREDIGSIFYLNPFPWNVLRPCDAVSLDTYSDARSVLTGIIDQPDNLRKISENVLKTLVWVLLHHCKGLPQEDKIMKSTVAVSTNDDVEPGQEAKPANGSHKDFKLSNQEEVKVRRSSSLPSLSDSIWSHESLSLSASNATRLNKTGDSMFAEGIYDDSDTFDLGGFPALDTGKQQAPIKSGLVGESDEAFSTLRQLQEGNTSLLSGINSTNAVKMNSNSQGVVTKVDVAFKTEHSYKMDMPLQWKVDLPLTRSQVDTLLCKFPVSWYEYVIRSLDFGDDSENIREVLVTDSILMRLYEELVLMCYALLEVLGYPGSTSLQAGPGHAYKVFTGQIPWSLHLDWLQNDKQLSSLVIKAYRYAFKLMYDEAVLGEVSDDDELAQYLTEYDSDWVMGSDTDSDWQQAVLAGKPNLFSVGRDKEKGTYTSRVLTKQHILAPVGRLNAEAVRGHWASLALELLYFTNDDEERYSIQAHPVLLRNLTIQAADPPLGYPIFSSGASQIPVRVPPI